MQMAQLDWHQVRMELTGPQRRGSRIVESANAQPDELRSRPLSDSDGTDALLEHIALALADRVDDVPS
jgi:hypothetical protein